MNWKKINESEENSNGWEKGECHWREMRQDLLEPLTDFIRRMKEGTVEFWSDTEENGGSKLGDFGMDDIIKFILKCLTAHPQIKHPFFAPYFQIMRAFGKDVGITCNPEDNISTTSFSSCGSSGLTAIPQKYGVDDSHTHTLYEMAMKRNGYDVNMSKDEFIKTYGENEVTESIKTTDRMSKELFDELWSKVEMKLNKYSGVRGGIPIGLVDSIKDTMKKYVDDTRTKQIIESEETGNWFDEFGYLIRDLPQECIDACSHGGSCDDDVAFWVEELEFDKGLPVKMAKRWLKATGGWTDDDFEDWTTKDIAERVLWVICGNIKDFPDYIPCLEW